MAITSESRTEIIELVVGMFNAAPGADYLNEFVNAYEAGSTRAQLAENLAATSVFKSIYPDLQTSEEFATKLVNNLVGDLVDADNKAWAVDWIVSQLNAGSSKAEVIMTAIDELSALTSDATWGAAATALANKVEVAEWYSVDQLASSTSLSELQNVIADITEDPATVTAATSGSAQSGQTFTLTTGQDNIQGTSGNDTILGLVDGADNTLTLGDVINGGTGTDTLNITTDQDGFAGATATISNVEALVVNATASGTQVNTSSFNLNRVAYDSATLEGIQGADGGATGVVTVDNVNLATEVVLKTVSEAGVTVNFAGATGSSDTATVTVAGSSEANGDDNDLTVGAVETLNLNFTTDDNAIATLTAAAAETVNIAVASGADTTLSEAAALSAAETVTINATGDLTLAATADLAADAAITVSGAGDVDLATLEAGEKTVDASAMTGDLTVTGAANTASITAGAGDDSVTTGAVTTEVALGAGDDTFDANDLDFGGATAVDIEGGEGTDTIVIADGADLDADYAAHIKNFETLDVVGGTGTYDLDQYSFDAVNVSGDIQAAGVTVDNITDETLNITGDVATGTLTYALKDASGSSDALTVNIEGVYSNAGTPNDTTDDANDVEVAEIITAGIETVTLNSGDNDAHEAGVDNEVTVLATDATKLVVTGDHTLTIRDFQDDTSGGVNTDTVTIDASASTGGLIMGDFVSGTGVSLIGSEVADTLLVGDTVGDGSGNETGSTINAGKGGDVVTISAGAGTQAVDTIIINAGDSMIGYTDTNESDTYTAAADAEHFDVITGFTSGEDTIDLGSFGFTGQKASALADQALTAAEVVELIDGTETEIADFFVDTGVQRGVATVEGIDASTFGGAAGSTLVFIDSDGDGSLNVANDDMIVLSGTATVSLADFGF